MANDLNSWYKGTKPCKYCDHMSVKHKKWFDWKTDKFGRMYRCSNCSKEWYEQKWFDKKGDR